LKILSLNNTKVSQWKNLLIILISYIYRYTNAVVAPWYRPMEQANYFYVEEVCDDMTPASAFPDDNYTSFNEYFMKKYKLEIHNQSQAMLDVDYTTARYVCVCVNTIYFFPIYRLNMLTARVPSRRALQMKEIRDRQGHVVGGGIQKQLLVPELVDIHPLPATLWHQIVLLPSVLYRYVFGVIWINFLQFKWTTYCG
jgi:endoribonuclease Dicer